MIGNSIHSTAFRHRCWSAVPHFAVRLCLPNSVTANRPVSAAPLVFGQLSEVWRRPLLWAFVLFILFTGGCGGRAYQRRETWVELARRDAVPLGQLPELVHGSRIVLLGEGHALVEPIETLRMLLSATNSCGWTHVAFEWSVTDQLDLDRYMSGDDTVMELFRKRYGQLPGATIEYFETFSFIREGNRAHPNRLVKACAVDVPHPVRNIAEAERDRYMFTQIEELIEASSSHRVLVHCGASHNRKSGVNDLPTREGSTVPQPTLGALLCERYPGSVVSIKVLSPHDPIWRRIKDEALFQNPVVIPTTIRWPNPQGLFSLYRWHPDPSGRDSSAKSVYDYLVWWPTSRDGKRAP